jgi:predicted dehydrogenase
MEIRIGVIGVGGLGYLQAEAYSHIDDVNIVGAADIAAEARQLFEREFDAPAYEHYRELLHSHGDELDAVTIITPHTLHHEQTRACLEAGLHVLIEKPMVTDIGHAVDLIETASERDAVLMVGYQRHFHPAFREIRRIVGSGRIGDLHTANCYLGQDWIEIVVVPVPTPSDVPAFRLFAPFYDPGGNHARSNSAGRDHIACLEYLAIIYTLGRGVEKKWTRGENVLIDVRIRVLWLTLF